MLVAHPDGFANEDYRRLNGVDRDEAYREIQEMVALGVVLPAQTPGRGAVYRVAREAAARAAEKNAQNDNAKDAIASAHFGRAPAWLAERAAPLHAYFTKHPALKNADYCEMFELGRDAAVRELRRLVLEGYLRMEGERRGAHYLPGPALRRTEG